jgi:hypothetical protein
VQVTGPLAGTTEYEEPPGPVPPADAREEDLAALQAQTWASASLSVAGIRVQGFKGKVPGYNSCSFRVEFTPRVAGESPAATATACPARSDLHLNCAIAKQRRKPGHWFFGIDNEFRVYHGIFEWSDHSVDVKLSVQVLWRFLCWCHSLRPTTRPWLSLP